MPRLDLSASLRPLGAALLVALATAAAATDDGAVSLDLAAQPLDAAIASLSHQAGVEVLYDAALTAGRTAPALSGTFTPAEALARLLAGSGLEARFVAPGKATLVRAPPPPPKATAAPAPQRAELEEVAVTERKERTYAVAAATTGTKTDTPLLETPVAVLVVPQQVLQDQQVTKLEQALTNTSGVFAYSVGQGCNGTCESLNLRGFQTFTPAVTDGLAMPKAGGLTTMTNVESVEVMKGPASILYGRLEPGGVVNVVTKKPGRTAAYAVEQGAGTRSAFLPSVDATGPVDADGRFLYRLIASWDSQRQLYSDQTNRAGLVAPSLQWNASEETQVLLEGTYTSDRVALLVENNPVDPITGATVQLPPSGNRNPNLQFNQTTAGRLTLSQQLTSGWALKARYAESRSRSHSGDESFAIVGFTQVGSTWTVDRALLVSTGSTTSRTADLSLTGHFETGPARHTLLAGADGNFIKSSSASGNNIDAAAFDYVRDTTDAFAPSRPAAGQTPNTWQETRSVDTRLGLYLQEQVKLPFDVHLLAGVRYSHVSYQSRDLTSGVFVTDFGVPPLSVRPTRNDAAVTPRAGALWEAVKGTSLYASYSENFGAFQPAFDFQGNALDPQLARQWEVGAKQQSADGKRSASVALFDIRKTNEAIPDPEHTGCRSGFTGVVDPANDCFKAAGKTRSRGVELDFAGEVLAGWNLLTSFTLTDARILDNGGQAGEGGRLGYFPRQMARLATTYAFGPGLKVGGGATYVGSTDLGNTGAQQTVTPAYTIYDAMAAYAFGIGSGRFKLQVNVKNLLDKRYLITASKNAFFSVTPHGDPRSVLASLRADF